MTVIRLKKEYFSLLIIACCIYLLFKFPESVKIGVTDGLAICFYTIIPSLFPFMILSCYITKSNIISYFGKFLTPISRVIFRQPVHSISAIIMSNIGGFPVGIKMVNELYSRGQITKNQAHRLCVFCINGGPAFVITAVGVNMLKSMRAGVIIYVSLVLSSLILGIMSSFLGDKNEVIDNQKAEIQQPLSCLSASVSDSLQSVLGICAWVTLFSGISNCISSLKLNENVYLFLISVLEVTTGCVNIAGKMHLSVMAGIIGFGGICVHCQVLSYIKSIGMKYTHFLVSRILGGALSALISYLLFMAFPVETDVFVNLGSVASADFSVSVPAFFVFILMCIIMIFDIDKKKKIC